MSDQIEQMIAERDLAKVAKTEMENTLKEALRREVVLELKVLQLIDIVHIMADHLQ